MAKIKFGELQLEARPAIAPEKKSEPEVIIQEKIIEVPVEKIVERIIEKIVEIPRSPSDIDQISKRCEKCEDTRKQCNEIEDTMAAKSEELNDMIEACIAKQDSSDQNSIIMNTLVHKEIVPEIQCINGQLEKLHDNENRQTKISIILCGMMFLLIILSLTI